MTCACSLWELSTVRFLVLFSYSQTELIIFFQTKLTSDFSTTCPEVCRINLCHLDLDTGDGTSQWGCATLKQMIKSNLWLFFAMPLEDKLYFVIGNVIVVSEELSYIWRIRAALFWNIDTWTFFATPVKHWSTSPEVVDKTLLPASRVIFMLLDLNLFCHAIFRPSRSNISENRKYFFHPGVILRNYQKYFVPHWHINFGPSKESLKFLAIKN